MSQTEKLLEQILTVLQSTAPKTRAPVDWMSYPAYIWDCDHVETLESIDAPEIEWLRAIENQLEATLANIDRFTNGFAAHDMLFWGARGMGKSALVRAAVSAAQREKSSEIALVQVAAGALDSLPQLFRELAPLERRFIIFVDDLSFFETDRAYHRQMRSWLDGGVEARPGNTRFAVTTNQNVMAPVPGDDADCAHSLHDDALALADRFGLALEFVPCTQNEFLEIVATYMNGLDIEHSVKDALDWSKKRGSRSGRAAWQYIVEVAGQMGKEQ